MKKKRCFDIVADRKIGKFSAENLRLIGITKK
jgi:hypothetical protein